MKIINTPRTYTYMNMERVTHMNDIKMPMHTQKNHTRIWICTHTPAPSFAYTCSPPLQGVCSTDLERGTCAVRRRSWSGCSGSCDSTCMRAYLHFVFEMQNYVRQKFFEVVNCSFWGWYTVWRLQMFCVRVCMCVRCCGGVVVVFWWICPDIDYDTFGLIL